MFLSEIRKAKDLFDKQQDAREEADTEKKDSAWDEYWDYQKKISRENGISWSLHSVIDSIYYNRNVRAKDRFKVLIKVLKAMNIDVVDDEKESK